MGQRSVSFVAFGKISDFGDCDWLFSKIMN